MKFQIETNRLLLREIQTTDIEGLFELDSDPEVHKYLGNTPVKKREQIIPMIEYIQQQYKDNGIGRWAIIDKETKDFIGWTGLKYEDELRVFPYYDLGYRLKRAYWGKGIATETALASLKYGFEEMDLEEIGGAADIEHVASNKILKKVGLKFIDTFEYVGVEHNWYKIKREDWLNRK